MILRGKGHVYEAEAPAYHPAVRVVFQEQVLNIIHSEFRWFLRLSLHLCMLSRSSSINHNFSPVCFPLTWQDNAWLDHDVFLEWIKEVVVPYAEDRSRLHGFNEDQANSKLFQHYCKNVSCHFGHVSIDTLAHDPVGLLWVF